MVSALLSPDVSLTVQERGRIYFRRGHVRILKGSENEVRATVQGSRQYQVRLTTSEDGLELSCTCPFAHSEGVCKHMWATVLAADARRYLTGLRATSLQPVAPKSATPPKPRAWESRLAEIENDRKLRSGKPLVWPERRQLIYTIAVRTGQQQVSFLLSTRERKANGTGWNAPKDLRITSADIQHLPDPGDRAILVLLGGASTSYGWTYSDYNNFAHQREAGHPLIGLVMPLMCRTGRCFFRPEGESESVPIEWDEGPAWRLALGLSRSGENWIVDGVLRQGEDRETPLRTPVVLVPGLVISRAEGKAMAAGLDADTPHEWATHLRKNGPILAQGKDGDALLERLLTDAGSPMVQVPEELRYDDRSVAPRPRLHIRNQREASTQLEASLAFNYDGRSVAADESGPPALFDAQNRILMRRDKAAEAAAARRLAELGVRWEAASYMNPSGGWRIPSKKLPVLVRTLLKEEWQVEAEGKLFRAPGSTQVAISSGLDWFELRGEVDYDGTPVSLPELLAAVRRGEQVVQLGDGTFGLLPEEYLERFGFLAGLGESQRDHIRFERRQAGLLDAMLATQEVRVDEGFAHARAQLRRFEGVQEAQQPAGFEGALRGYQREGLGWIHFLRQFGFGGCLADDMGVGKTPQVLALLEHRREQREGAPADAGNDAPAAPSLVVVPRSLVFNWKQEAARFTPHLRILDHTGVDRNIERFNEYDLILTTYGTLRRDIVAMRDFEFDYVILDEAQAIKNAGTDAAKAARLLRARYRLVMSGTPVENRLADLWSLFEFLNPGMLGGGKAFGLLSSSGKAAGEEARAALSQALRPLILRRTKEQVARELPDKTEQTIFCEMKPAQQKLYNELREYYRASLLNRIDKDGLAKSKMHVLEALLRLRQAACHPGLVDKTRGSEPSAKVDLLLDRLEEIAGEGHKALVFSQFTSLLSIVRARLEQRGISFEYLDGQTKDRQVVVERFQTDRDCRAFLISLKAGGVGLNLTAAEYVFLLDPWWNPAVEAQAIDRTHRIGQTQHVFAYRLIARGTVEEKILELQQTKRELAAAIITEDNRVLSNLRREDLEQLLS